MKLFSAVLCFIIALISPHSVLATEQLSLMPYPLSVTTEAGYFQFDQDYSIAFEGMSPQRKHYAKTTFQHQLNLSQFSALQRPFKQVPVGQASTKISIMVDNAPEYRLPQLGDDESYLLSINQQRIKITAQSEFGALHALTTLSQLIATSNTPNQLVALNISDTPRFKWRGLLIDSVRHFLPTEAIKRQLDGMAAAKLNVFHWHLTDDQGWRIESKAYPKLHQLASDGLFYSREEIKSVVEYASLRGIRVLPEFDIPGHASAIAVAYPELTSKNTQYHMERHWGVFEPLLDPSNDNVYQFIEAIVIELTQLFPDAYLHIGGDEVDPTHWQENPKIQAFMQDNGIDDTHGLQTFFNAKVQKILKKHQRNMMGWDEIFHQDLPKDIVVQSWQGLESLNHIARAGYQGLLSTGYYIDQPQTTAYHYRIDPLTHSDIVVPDLIKHPHWQSWRLSMPRLKGSAVTGTLTLVNKPNSPIEGYLKLNNNYHKKVKIQDIMQSNSITHITFDVDTWMGPLRAELDFTNPLSIAGRMLIGNTVYPVTGHKKLTTAAPNITTLPAIEPKHAKNILGGEAALWSEIVDHKNIDLRTWPRLFAIAERFWSDKSLTNSDDMYRRLQVMDQYAATVIGLQHHQQLTNGLKSLLDRPNSDAIALLRTLAQATEPAHYYTRHHLKYRKDQYHQQAPLDTFVDYLPVESFTLINLNQQLRSYQQGETQLLNVLKTTLTNWQVAAKKLKRLANRNVKLQHLSPTIQRFDELTVLGLDLVAQCHNDTLLTAKASQLLKKKLDKLHNSQEEVVLAAVQLINNLRRVCIK